MFGCDEWESVITEEIDLFLSEELSLRSMRRLLETLGINLQDETEEAIGPINTLKAVLIYGHESVDVSAVEMDYLQTAPEAIFLSYGRIKILAIELNCSCSEYYLYAAAVIKIFNKSFDFPVLYFFKVKAHLVLGLGNRFFVGENEFFVTDLFSENNIEDLLTFFEEWFFFGNWNFWGYLSQYSTIAGLRYRTLQDREEMLCGGYTYEYVCRTLDAVGRDVQESSYDQLEAAQKALEKTQENSDKEIQLSFSDYEDDDTEELISHISPEAFENAEKMLEELLG